MDQILSDFEKSCGSVLIHLKEDLGAIRTGKANPGIIENLPVETYGGQAKLRLMELSTITTAGPSLLMVAPFDPSTTKDIERAILKSPLGLSPRPDGTKLMITIPSLNEEQRQKMTKLVGQKAEERKVMIRNKRDEARKKIRNDFEAKNISEDQKFRLEKELDQLSQEFTEKIQEIREKKDQEIMLI